jgi:hypothetical protein
MSSYPEAPEGWTPVARRTAVHSVIQLAGTLLFSRDTFRAMQTGLEQPWYDQLVWRPDAVGSACFFISGYLASVSRPLARSRSSTHFRISPSRYCPAARPPTR